MRYGAVGSGKVRFGVVWSGLVKYGEVRFSSDELPTWWSSKVRFLGREQH